MTSFDNITLASYCTQTSELAATRGIYTSAFETVFKFHVHFSHVVIALAISMHNKIPEILSLIFTN